MNSGSPKSLKQLDSSPPRPILSSQRSSQAIEEVIGDTKESETHGSAKVLGAAGMDVRGDVEGDLVDLMCVLCSRMRA
jgi:hypothetical protein